MILLLINLEAEIKMVNKTLVSAIGITVTTFGLAAGIIGYERGYKSRVNSDAPARVFYTNADGENNSSQENDDLVVGRADGKTEVYLRNGYGNYDNTESLRKKEISNTEGTRNSELGKHKTWYDGEVQKVRKTYSDLRKKLDETH